jgi:hypothetical protein
VIYERTSDGYRCRTHGVDFGLIDSCPHGPDCGDSTHDHADPPDAEATSHDSWLLERRDEVIALAKQMAEERDERGAIDRAGYSTVFKGYETALKYERTYLERKDKRDEKSHDEWLVEQNRMLRGAGIQ